MKGSLLHWQVRRDINDRKAQGRLDTHLAEQNGAMRDRSSQQDEGERMRGIHHIFGQGGAFNTHTYAFILRQAHGNAR